MNKRVFVCSDKKFPRGDAGANLILNICRALNLENHETLVVSEGKEGCGEYGGVRCDNPHYGEGKAGKLYKYIFGANRIIKNLKKHSFNENDFCLIYSSNYFFVRKMMTFCHKKIKASCAPYIVEWHQPFQFGGEDSLLYRLYKRTFNKYFPMSGKVAAISTCLKDHFEKMGCSVCLIPVFIDTGEFAFADKGCTDTINLTYSGNPYLKDNFECMLASLAELDDEHLSRFKLHLTGMKTSDVKAAAGDRAELLLERLKNVIVCHGWLEYDDLLEIYRNTDFLFLSKPDNTVTKANFPSKVPEMLSFGIAPIINRVGDISSYLTDGEDSIIYQKDSVDDCKAALIRITALSPEELSHIRRGARKTAEDKFDYRVWASRISGFFNS